MSVDLVDVVDRVATVAIVATVRVDTDDVMRGRARRVAHRASLLLRSVVALAVVVVLLLLPRATAVGDNCSDYVRAAWAGGLDGSVFGRVREIAGGA